MNIKCNDPDCYVCKTYLPDDFFRQVYVEHGPRWEIGTIKIDGVERMNVTTGTIRGRMIDDTIAEGNNKAEYHRSMAITYTKVLIVMLACLGVKWIMEQLG